MQKQCKCGDSMSLHLRTVIFSNKVEIENVPIYSCDSCSSSEVIPEVKPELTGLIGGLGTNPSKQQLYFNEYNELAHLMCAVSQKDQVHIPVQKILEDRINQLLDLLLLANSLNDEAWIADVQNRLKQVTRHATYDLKTLGP
ncbi:hypothetical protein [Paenibacillus turpanensis]|uniref:hypothetical protein n=1 Tax=Paenibacillus turpanensis TaxID=2689078 RepID=UPI00140C227F|nr:hypothetical protein [Paenibacillus turpanensis]